MHAPRCFCRSRTSAGIQLAGTRAGAAFRAFDSQPFRQGAGKGLHVARAQRQAVIRHRSRNGGRAFHHVEAVHGGLGAGDAPLIRKVVRIADRARSGAEEIRVQGDDHVRLIEVINGVDVLAEGQLGAFADRVAAARLILMPLRLRELREHRPDLVRQRGRSHHARQNAQPRTLQSEEIGRDVGPSR